MRMLDLYCGEGLAAWGYWLSGRFHEIVGIDIENEMRTRYSFNFQQGNALNLTYDFLDQFDFIHSSPPCQAYSKVTPDKSKHMRLVAATHLMLHASGKPYVIENVEGSGIELRPNIVMNGWFFGLPSNRRRYFYAEGLEAGRFIMKEKIGEKIINIHGGATRSETIEALGLDVIPPIRLRNITQHGMEQGIPPAMTKHIAELIFPNKAMIGE